MSTPLIRGRPPASKKWAWSPIPSGGSRASCAATARIPLPPLAPGGAHHRPHPGPRSLHGIDSPVGRVWLDGQVLLLGISHIRHTIHLAELLAGVRYRRPSPSSFARASRSPASTTARTTTAARTLPSWLAGWTRRVSSAAAWWVMPGAPGRSRDIVETVVERLRAEETIFLHPYGVDEECDEARASIPF